jgi:hypothetical protein
MSALVFVPVLDLASSIERVDAELALARRRGDHDEISKFELILLNMQNLQNKKDILNQYITR